MIGISIGVLFCCLLGFLIARFAFKQAKSRTHRLQLAGFCVLLALFLVGMWGAANRVKRFNARVTSAEIIRTVAAGKELEAQGQYIVAEGTISTQNDTRSATPYVAYLRWNPGEDDSDFDEIELPDLLIELEDGVIAIEPGLYNQINWPESEDGVYRYRHLSHGDRVVITGEPYLGTRVKGGESAEQLYIAATALYAGNGNGFDSDYAPTLRRTARYAQIVSTFALIAAVFMLTIPIPHLIGTRNQSSA